MSQKGATCRYFFVSKEFILGFAAVILLIISVSASFPR